MGIYCDSTPLKARFIQLRAKLSPGDKFCNYMKNNQKQRDFMKMPRSFFYCVVLWEEEEVAFLLLPFSLL